MMNELLVLGGFVAVAAALSFGWQLGQSLWRCACGLMNVFVVAVFGFITLVIGSWVLEEVQEEVRPVRLRVRK